MSLQTGDTVPSAKTEILTLYLYIYIRPGKLVSIYPPWPRRLPPSAGTPQSCSCELAPHGRIAEREGRHHAAALESSHQIRVQRMIILRSGGGREVGVRGKGDREGRGEGMIGKRGEEGSLIDTYSIQLGYCIGIKFCGSNLHKFCKLWIICEIISTNF